MIYSVWNQPSRQYDYYENQHNQATANTPGPGHIPFVEGGVPIDRATWPLPQDSSKVGSGSSPKGRIASLPRATNALEGYPMDANMFGMLGLGLAAFLLWRRGFSKA